MALAKSSRTTTASRLRKQEMDRPFQGMSFTPRPPTLKSTAAMLTNTRPFLSLMDGSPLPVFCIALF